MKKILILFMLVVAAVMVSCSKDDAAQNTVSTQITPEMEVISRASLAAAIAPDSYPATKINLSSKRIELELAKIEVEKAKMNSDTVTVHQLQKEVDRINAEVEKAKEIKDKKKAELKSRGLPTCWGR